VVGGKATLKNLPNALTGNTQLALAA